jgi:hypothetical protein
VKKIALLLVVLAVGGYGAHEIWQRMSSCGVDLRSELTSPNGARRAVVYGMECGATVGLNTQVAIVAKGQTFRPERILPFFAIDGRYALAVAWQDDKTLVIEMPRPAPRIYKKADEAGSIDILYR